MGCLWLPANCPGGLRQDRSQMFEPHQSANDAEGTFTRVEEEQVENLQPLTPCEVKDIGTTRVTEAPGHLAELYKTAKSGCEEPLHARKLARFLTEYSTVFSTREGGVGQTTLVEHRFPVEESTRIIGQPPHQPGPEKEAETERQVAELLEKRTDRAGRKSLEFLSCSSEEKE